MHESGVSMSILNQLRDRRVNQLVGVFSCREVNRGGWE